MVDEEVRFQRFDRQSVTDDLLKACSALYADHYGYWADDGVPEHLKGKSIKLSPERIAGYFAGGVGWLAAAYVGEQLVGYAIAVHLELSAGGVSWVTQMVVHERYQNQLVGSQMLKSIWGDSHDFAWGIASANPFAIRALEKATRRRCSPVYMMRHETVVRSIIGKIPFLHKCTTRISNFQSSINTEFFQDLSQVTARKDQASKRDQWVMGNINPGEEWLAITFNKQAQIEWTDEEFEKFTRMSSTIVRQAYERMSMQDPQETHAWAKPERAESEIDFLVKAIKLAPGSEVIDFGCGSGRHCNALAKKGVSVTGVDFSGAAIARARKNASTGEEYVEADCRDVKLDKIFDAGICLYDVIGSFSDDASNQKILDNLATHLRPNAMVAFSVMSFDYMEKIAIHKVGNGNVRSKLNGLKASNTMQTSGEIFDPEYVLLDTRNKIAYRREIFDNGSNLRVEQIVCDRRFTFNDITIMCEAAGLKLHAIGYIAAGNFGMLDQQPAVPTKEILVIARKFLI